MQTELLCEVGFVRCFGQAKLAYSEEPDELIKLQEIQC